MAELDEMLTNRALAKLADPAEYAELTEGSQDARVQAARDRVAEIKADYDETVSAVQRPQDQPTAFAEVEPGKLDDLKRAEKELAELETPSELHSLAWTPA